MTLPYQHRLCDRTGTSYLRVHQHVRITHPRHSYHDRTGTIVRIQGRRVWVALPGGLIVPAGHRSVEAL